jgi:hypothetical protein
VDYEEWLSELLPDDLKEAVELYNKLRNKVTDARTTYEQLEAIAVLSGVAPLGPGSRDIAPGPWAYAGNGFYMRALPSGYPRTTIEVIRPAPYTLERDDKGRIVVFRSGKYRVETSYDDSPGANVVSAPGQPDIHIWHFKKIRYAGPNPGEERVIENRGWILASPHQVTTQPMSPPLRASGLLIQLASLNSSIYLAQQDEIIPEQWKKAKERYDRAKKIKDLVDDINDYYEEQERAERPPSEEAIDDITDLDHYRDGLDAATDPADFEGRSEWLKDHFRRLTDAWNYVNCVLSGDCPPPGEQPTDPDDEWDDFDELDPSGNVATPANTNQQRLGLSRRLR